MNRAVAELPRWTHLGVDRLNHRHWCPWFTAEMETRPCDVGVKLPECTKQPKSRLTFTVFWSISPLQLSKYFFKSWSQYSKTIVRHDSLRITSNSLKNTVEKRLPLGAYLTMFLCFSSFNKQISLNAELGMPSSSFSSLIRFRATMSWVSRLRALYTFPYVPLSHKRKKTLANLHQFFRSSRTSGERADSWQKQPMAVR